MFSQSCNAAGTSDEDAASGWNKPAFRAPTNSTALAMAERWPDPAWLVRGDLHVEHANGPAVRIAGGSHVAPVIRLAASRLQAIGTANASALRQGGAQARRAGHSQMITLLPTTATAAAAGSPGPAIRRARLRSVDPSGGELRDPGFDPPLLLLVLESGLGDEAHEWLMRLATHFCLTRTELKVLRHVAHSATPAEIAAVLAVGTPTVRTHLRSLFSKTRCRRQADLVRQACA